jgi:hypothetical protein
MITQIVCLISSLSKKPESLYATATPPANILLLFSFFSTATLIGLAKHKLNSTLRYTRDTDSSSHQTRVLQRRGDRLIMAAKQMYATVTPRFPYLYQDIDVLIC